MFFIIVHPSIPCVYNLHTCLKKVFAFTAGISQIFGLEMRWNCILPYFALHMDKKEIQFYLNKAIEEEKMFNRMRLFHPMFKICVCVCVRVAAEDLM